MKKNILQSQFRWRIALLSFSILFFCNRSQATPTTLAAGDIVFVAYNMADNMLSTATINDSFAFMPLVDLESGTEIFFTDFGWTSDGGGSFAGNSCLVPGTSGAVTDGVIKWTASAFVSSGTIVWVTCRKAPLVSNRGTVTAVTATANNSDQYLSIQTGGDQLAAYQGTFTSPTLITIMGLNRSSWDATYTNCTYSSTQSLLPSALSSGTCAFLSGSSRTNGHFNCATLSGTVAEKRAIVYDASNWTFDNIGTPGSTFGPYVSYCLGSVASTPSVTVTSSTNVTCNGGTDGSATVSASGGTTPYTYSWAPSGGSTATATGLSAGTYTCTVTDAASGTVTVSVTITEPAVLSVTGANTMCATTTLTASQSGGTWSSSNTAVATVGSTGVVSGVAGGTAIISYVHACGTATKVVTVNLPNPGTVTGNTYGCVTAFISHTASGGTAGGVWSSSNPAVGTINPSNGLFADLTAGTTIVSYTVTNGCGSASDTMLTTVYALSDTGTISGPSSICVGSTGSFSSSTTTSGFPYSQAWSSSATAVGTINSSSGVATGISAGTTRVTYTKSGCGTFRAFRTLNVLPATTVAATAGTNTVVVGATTALSNATGGGTWSSSNTAVGTVDGSGVVTGLSIGTTTISYVVSGTCGTATATMNVTVLTAFSATISAQTNVACHGGSTGSATVSVSGGTSPFAYSWAPGGGTAATATGLAAGTYTCTVTDAASETASVTVTITQPSAPVGGSTVITNVACNGGANGAINLTPSGGVSPYTFSWNGGASTEDRTSLSAGSYSVAITDANSCTGTVTATVTQPSAPVEGSTVVTNVACFGGGTGAINLTPSGGVGSYTFNWNGGATTEDRTGLSAGSYTVVITDANSCTGTVTATVTQPSSAVGGSTTVTNVACNGGTTGAINLTPSGGVSPYTFNWNGGATTEDRTGLSAGSYTVVITDANSCTSTVTATVTQPSALTASVSSVTNVACFGASTGAATVTAGGGASGYTYSWAPSGGTAATATGRPAGSYTCTVTDANSCTTTAVATITQPASGLTISSLTGSGSYCVGNTINLSVSGTGGTGGYTYSWSGPSFSSSSQSPTLSSVTTAQTGVYTVTVTDANSCTATGTASVTVNTNPSASTGETYDCVGGSITLSNSTGGGTWSSSDISLATVGSSTGVVAGVGSGTVNITYTVGTGCFDVKSIDINPAMASITGTTNVCIGTTTDLDHSFPGGTWSTAVPYYATVDASTGIVTGAHVGSTPVTYTVNEGCVATASIYIPNIVLNITGGLESCEGLNSTLVVAGWPGGTWSSDDTDIAYINGVTGVMTAVSAGTVEITYTYAYCFTTKTATINSVPASITGGSSVCAGGSLSLACSTGGGVWSSSNTARATVDGSGTVTAISAGTVTISYTLGTGCAATKVIAVGAMPAAITGITTMCEGATATLTCTTTGGTWSSSATGTADIVSTSGTSAVISGIAAGGATISYNHSGGCVQTVNVTVTAPPSGISGALSIGVGGTSTLTCTTGGGTWSSSMPSKATINSVTGVVTGVSGGTATITYSTGATCYTTAVVTVNTPPTITGPTGVCIGANATMTFSISGGTWSSSNTAVATIDAGTGEVTGIAAGAINLTYTISAGYFSVRNLYVYNNPPAITGASSICTGAVTALTTIAGGAASWTSSDTTVATVNNSGGVTALSVGVTTITYMTTATGCYVTKAVTVNETPGAISGASTLCAGATETYTSSPSGGTWTSSTTARATINGSTGVATGLTPGGTTIRYTLSTGCQVVKPVTVTALPAAITGTGVVCVGNSVVLSSTTSGATWSTSASGTASITATTATTATVGGVTTGTADISYSNAAGCSRVATVTVNTAVADITGENVVCVGGAVTLANATGGGTWSTISPYRVSVGATTGVVTGSSAGSTVVSYKVSAGCHTSKTITVNAALPNITGAAYTCSGTAGAVTFSNSVSGGTWSSSNTSVAVVDPSTGLVTGVLMGGFNTYVNIIYATSAGCTKSKSILIKPQPVITGADEVTVGSTAAMTGSPAGGAWASSSTATATVTGYGVVAGVSGGSATISYTYSGCLNTKDITVTGGSSSRPAGMSEEAVTLFSVFPNPSRGSLSVNTGVAGTFVVYTVDGKQVSVSELTEGTSAISMPSGLAAGTYLCRFQGADGSVQAVRLVYEP